MAETPLDDAVLALGSICGVECRDEAERLLAAANNDLQLCVYRLHQQQKAEAAGGPLRAIKAQVDAGAPLARTDSAGRSVALLPQALEVTVVGVSRLFYSRPREHDTLLTNYVYVLVEHAGREWRTQPVRRSSRPHWHQVFTHRRCSDDGDASSTLRVTLLDLNHNIIGSCHHQISEGVADATAHEELLSTIDLPDDARAVVGTLELRVRPQAYAVAESPGIKGRRLLSTPMAGRARRSDAITFESPGLAEQLTQLYLDGLEKDLVQCPGCASRFSMIPGKAGEVAAGAGPLSEAAALDYSRHRVRCIECELEFCASCAHAPFHTGEVSCQTAKQAKATRSCRFCSVPLDSAGSLPAEHGFGWRRSTRIEDSWCSSTASEEERYRPTLVCRPLFPDGAQDADRHWAWTSKRWKQGGAAEAEPPQWLAFDLREKCHVRKMRIVSSSTSYAPKNYTVERSEVSPLGPWEALYAFEDERKDWSENGREREQVFEGLNAGVPEASGGGFSARWVRVVFHSTFGGAQLQIKHLHWHTSLAALADVCPADECQQLAQASCDRRLPCGHACCGILGERECGPCLHCLADKTASEYETTLREDAASSEQQLVDGLAHFSKLKVQGTSAHEFCPLCWTDSLGTAPSITLGCGHTLHAHCVQQQVERNWPGGPINFSFMECPVCRQDLTHPLIDKDLEAHRKLRKQVKLMAVEVAQEEHGGPAAVQLLADAASEDIESYAVRQSVFKQCFQCKSPFFFGAAHCGGAAAQAAAQEEDKEGIICKECEAIAGVEESCDRHGTDHLMWKCRYCCSPATYECFSYAHFCHECHEFPAINQLMNFNKPMVTGPLPYCKYTGNQYVNTKELYEYTPCKGCNDNGKSCPLGVVHARTGVEHCLGCTLCAVDRDNAADLVKQLKAVVPEHEYEASKHRADERDREKVRLELAANMLRDGGALARDALLAGRLTKREALLWMRDWGLGSGALLRIGLKGKNPAAVAKAKTVREVASCLSRFIMKEAPQLPALVEVLNREALVATTVQAVWRGRCTREVTAVQMVRFRAARRIQSVWRGMLTRCITERVIATWIPAATGPSEHGGGGDTRRKCGLRILFGTNELRREHRAAVRIQACFRGMKPRRTGEVALFLCGAAEEEDVSEPRMSEPQRRLLLQRFTVSALKARNAAIRLQKQWRGLWVRTTHVEQLEYMQRLRLMRTWLGTSRCIADPAIVFFFPAMPKPGHHPGGQEEPTLLPIPAKLQLQPEPVRRIRWVDAEGQPVARAAGAHAQVLGIPKAPPLPPKGWRPEKLFCVRSQLDQGQGYSNAGLFVARAARWLGHCYGDACC
jgi:hypothetical protein